MIVSRPGLAQPITEPADLRAGPSIRPAAPGAQRSNMPVRELAAQIVAKTAQVPPERVRRISRGDEVA